MGLIERLKRIIRAPNEKLAALTIGLDNQSRLINQRLSEVVAGLDNQTRLLADRLGETIQCLNYQSQLLADKVDKGVTEGLDNQSRLVNQRLTEVAAGLDNQARLFSDRLEATIQCLDNQAQLLVDKLDSGIVEGLDNQSKFLDERLGDVLRGFSASAEAIVHEMGNQSRMLSERLDAMLGGIDNLAQALGKGSSDPKPSRIATPEIIVRDYPHGALRPEQFRDLLLERGAVMLRNAADSHLLDQIKRQLDKLFAEYAKTPAAELKKHLASDDPTTRAYWEHIKAGQIYEAAFEPLAGLSFFDIVRHNGLWDLTSRAFPESEVVQSRASNCHRATVAKSSGLPNQRPEFYVDAQHHYIHQLSINFWTPLMACGRDAPGIEVVLMGAQETKRYLEFNLAGYDKRPGDIKHMHHFHSDKGRLESLREQGLDRHVWAPEFNKGDILAFTSLTMHATHYGPKMTKPRLSVEALVNLPSVPL